MGVPKIEKIGLAEVICGNK